MNSEPAKNGLFVFGAFEFDARDKILRRGAAVVSLAPKSGELLAFFLANAGRLLTKDELMEKVWADAFVEESNLSHHVAVLRKVLKSGGGEKFIETLPRKGYRFVAPIETKREATGEIVVTEKTSRLVVEELEIDTEDDERQEISKLLSRAASQIGAPKKQARIGIALQIGLLAATMILIAAVASFVRTFSANQTRPTNQNAVRLAPLTTFEGDELEASLSPDGKFVAYSGSDIKTERTEASAPPLARRFNIYVKQTDGESAPVQITDRPAGSRAISPAWSPDGRSIAYAQYQMREGTENNILYVVPAFGGAERKIYEAPHLAFVSWSPDGKTIVFAASLDAQTAQRALFSVSLDDYNARQITRPPEGASDEYPTVSPDGKTVSFNRARNKTAEIFTVPVDGGEEARAITNDKRFAYGRAAWTPDGRSLIFGSNRGGSFTLWKVSADGAGEPQPLDVAGEPAFDVSISADGTRLVYTRQDIDFNVWRAPVEAGKISRAGEAENLRDAEESNATEKPNGAQKIVASSRADKCPAVSPDASRIAFSSNQHGGREIWLADSDGANQKMLTALKDANASHPAFSPDGSTLAFDAAPEGNSQIFVQSIASGRPLALTSADFEAIAPSWSRDGRFVFYGANRGGAWQIWRVAATGGEPLQITKQGGYEAHESIDGRYLYYNKAGYGTNGIFRLPTNDYAAPEEKIFDLAQVDSVGEWSLYGNGMFYLYRYEKTHDRPTREPRIRFYDFTTGAFSDVVSLPLNPLSDPCLSIALDGRNIFYSIQDHVNVDIMLAENFDY